MEKVAGQSLPGTGCLSVMFWINLIGMTLTVLCICSFLAISMFSAASSTSGMFAPVTPVR